MTNGKPVVFVVDEDLRVGEAISRLAAVMNLGCQVYESGQRFLESLDRWQCGCVVAELTTADVGGLLLLQRLQGEGVTLPVIILTAHATVPTAVRAMRGGAFSVLEKPFSERELWDTIEGAVSQDRERCLAKERERQLRTRLAAISSKEEEVLRLIAEGKCNRKIAEELDLSIRTIEVRRNSLLKKLGLRVPEELPEFAVKMCNGNGRAVRRAERRPG